MVERKGGLRVDPAVAAFKEKAATNTAALTRKQRRDRRRVTAKYDVPEEVKAAVDRLSDVDHWDTSFSQTAALLLAWTIKEYLNGNIGIWSAYETGREFARTPRFSWNVEAPDAWLGMLRQFADGSDDKGAR